MVNITSLNATSGIVLSIKSVLPTIFNNRTISAISNFVETVATVFKINIDQLNEFFNNTFIATSSGVVLHGLIKDLSGMSPYDGESDSDFRNRYYDWCYHYNATSESISGIVFDVIGEEADRIYSLSDRNAFWQEKNNPTRTYQKKYFYDDIGKNRVFWNTDSQEKGFIGYIYLREKPSDTVLSKLIDTIEQVKGQGTKIYILYPPSNDIIFEHKVESMHPSFLQNTSRLLNVNNMSLLNLPTQFNDARFYHILNSSGSVTIQDQTTFNNDFVISDLSSSIDWNYSNIGKGFYLNFASEDGANVTSETATNLPSFITPYYTYKGAYFDGNSAQGINITDTLHSSNEEYTKLTIKIQCKANSFASWRALINKGYYSPNTFEFRLLQNQNMILLQLWNYLDYGGNECNFAFTSPTNFDTLTTYNIIVSLNLNTKEKTFVVNGVDQISNCTFSGSLPFASLNKLRANVGAERKYEIGKTDNYSGWNYNGIIYRPYVSTSEFITTSQAIAEMVRFGF